MVVSFFRKVWHFCPELQGCEKNVREDLLFLSPSFLFEGLQFFYPHWRAALFRPRERPPLPPKTAQCAKKTHNLRFLPTETELYTLKACSFVFGIRTARPDVPTTYNEKQVWNN